MSWRSLSFILKINKKHYEYLENFKRKRLACLVIHRKQSVKEFGPHPRFNRCVFMIISSQFRRGRILNLEAYLWMLFYYCNSNDINMDRYMQFAFVEMNGQSARYSRQLGGWNRRTVIHREESCVLYSSVIYKLRTWGSLRTIVGIIRILRYTEHWYWIYGML